MIELKPCPFCGGRAAIYSSTKNIFLDDTAAWCYCTKCKSRGAEFEDTKNNGEFVIKAIEAWNRRVNDERRLHRPRKATKGY